ncbi:hypothetical protein JXA88_13550 [Candidatus Fermentibacteria bacterium]|nr:hypothetical protein [Candidatus Fermentibacteria bacterium]
MQSRPSIQRYGTGLTLILTAKRWCGVLTQGMERAGVVRSTKDVTRYDRVIQSWVQMLLPGLPDRVGQ